MKSQSVLGIDLGIGGIKLVELRNDQGRPRLVTFGNYQVTADIKDHKSWAEHKPLAVELIKELIEKTKARSRVVVSALPTFEVFSSLITLPPIADKELPNAIRLEAKKVVPRPLEEMILDWRQIGQQKVKAKIQEPGAIEQKEHEQRKILITAAPKKLVDSYVEIFRDAGLSLNGLETEAIALSRSLIGNDPSVVMIVDMGAKTTNLSIIEQGIPVVNRGVKFGGLQITKAIQEKLRVSFEEAEEWKRDQGSISQSSDLSPAVKEILDNVLHEIQYLFQMYRRQFQFDGVASNTIEKIVLTGGSAFVPGLPEYLAESLNVPVHLGDPWARVVYPEDLQMMLGELGPSMAVAVGLAMQAIV